LALSLSWASTAPAQSSGPRGSTNAPIRGAAIRPLTMPRNATNPVVSTNMLRQDEPERMEGGFLRMGFGKLSAFKYEIYEVYSEAHAGRPLLKSDDVIPDTVKAYDGRRVSIAGFVLPMRTKGGLVTEFLLLRDLGTCCFGPQAQINHFMRVKLSGPGFTADQTKPYRVWGTLHVGETYVRGYLTGIYTLDAEKVVEETQR
jgi:hypothetical protein